jgi:lipopolysaccharide biosynthesis glycosyltransferase
MDHSRAVVFAGDEGAAMPLAVAARSTVEKLSSAAQPALYMLDVGLSEQSRAKVTLTIKRARPDLEPRWLRVPQDRIAGLPHFPRLSTATHARLLISELLPSFVRRVVYLDADLLVRCDVSPLLGLDLEGSALAAVRDFLERPTRYFNAGVMAVDLERWRREAVGRRALAFAVSDPSVLNDQDALNVVVPNWRELDYRWNVQVGNLFFDGFRGLAPRPARGEFTDRLLARRWRLYRTAAVLHFVAGVKPWQRPCPLPGTTAWVMALIRTRWLSPREATIWVTRYALARTRYAIGTARLRLKARWG